jgi:hypothetical protein
LIYINNKEPNKSFELPAGKKVIIDNVLILWIKAYESKITKINTTKNQAKIW